MNVLVLNDKKPERDTIVRVLQQASYTVEAFADVKGAMSSITRAPPQVLVMSWPNIGGPDLIRLLRGADASHQMYLVAVLDPTPGGRDIPQPLAAGAHDVLRRPLLEPELVARVQAPTRLLKWATGVSRPVAFDLSTSMDVTALAMWKTMGNVVSADLAQMVGDDGPIRSGWPKGFDCNLRGATIAMSLASDQVEVRVSIIGDRTALRWLAGTLLGDADADEAAVNDVLRELANTAGGAVKRAALPDGIALTTGIPINEPVVRLQGDRVQNWTMPLDTGKACLAIVGEVRSRENQRVAASDLKEGMVLVHDLRSESGTLLVKAGSRLTTTTATRVAQMLGPRFLVEVACAA
jgi:CheY-like chemotaxis protein